MGDITAPRVVLEDGASFKGLVDMGERPEANRASNSKSKNASGSNRSPDADAKVESAGASAGARASSNKTEGSELLDKAAP
jgi:hypothetical protein